MLTSLADALEWDAIHLIKKCTVHETLPFRSQMKCARMAAGSGRAVKYFFMNEDSEGKSRIETEHVVHNSASK